MLLGRSTRRGRIVALLAVAAACLAVPALASARITVPPGATEGDQYFEEVPDGGGSGSVNHGGSGGAAGAGGGGGSISGPAVQATQALDNLGPDGRAAAALANANRPPAASHNNKAEVPATSSSSSPTEGEGGMGFWFPLLIAITAVAAIAYGLRRRMLPTG
jgi:hypothetical protein